MNRMILTLPLKRLAVKAVAGDAATGLLEGLASDYTAVDRQGDIVEAGAFAEAVRAVKAGGRLPMLWQHDPARPIGCWHELSESRMGLLARGKLALEVQQAREAKALIEAGAVTGLSIGFTLPDGGAVFDPRSGVRHIRALTLWEISLVTFPAHPGARVNRPAAEGAAALVEALRAARAAVGG